MAGCSIIFLMFIVLPIILIIAALLIGIALTTVFTAVASTVVFIVLNAKGFFKKYKDQEKPFQRYAPEFVRIFLIVVMSVSWILTLGIIILTLCFGPQRDKTPQHVVSDAAITADCLKQATSFFKDSDLDGLVNLFSETVRSGDRDLSSDTAELISELSDSRFENPEEYRSYICQRMCNC